MRTSSAAQDTSTDTIKRIIPCMESADEEYSTMWKNSTPQILGARQRKTWSNLVGHILSAIKQSFFNSTELPAQLGISLAVLNGWLISRCDKRHASVTDVKQILFELVKSENSFLSHEDNR